MADFAAVLRKAVEALKSNTPEARAKIYEKARATIEAKLTAASSPPQVADRQRALLEEAIAKVEAEYAPPPPPPVQEEDDLDDLLNELQTTDRRSKPVSQPASEKRDAGGPAPSTAPEVITTPPQREGAVYGGEGVRRGNVSDSALRAESAGALDHDIDWARTEQAPVEGPEALPPVEMHLPGSEPQHRRRFGGLVLLLLLLVVLGAAGYGGWLYRDEAAKLAGFASFDDLVAARSSSPAQEEEGGDVQAVAARTEQPAADEPAPEAQPTPERPRKFTQRLTPDGREVDEGPAGGEPGLGEGTSVAQATQESGASRQNEPASPNNSEQTALPVGQKAIFYEERTSVSQGYAESGSVVWSVVQESPGENLPPEPAIRAEATIPQKGLQLKMTIRRNADQSLPASHIIELIFLTPDDFAGGGINNVLRIAMKRSEQDPGSPLRGIPAKIADGFFLVALSDSGSDLQTNSSLLSRQSWIDIPIVYTSGRRALITLEKGVPGERIFTEALDAWAKASSG